MIWKKSHAGGSYSKKWFLRSVFSSLCLLDVIFPLKGLSALWKLGMRLIEERIRLVCEEIMDDVSIPDMERCVINLM